MQRVYASWMCFVSVFTLAPSFTGCSNQNDSSTELLNVSYDPTRELWRDINRRFIPVYEKEAGSKLVIKQSHGGSSTQARAVIDGLEADVVTLALYSDTDAIRQKGLITEGWVDLLPNRSLPYYSTVVFVVRKGNPKGIKDWKDIVQPDVQIIPGVQPVRLLCRGFGADLAGPGDAPLESWSRTPQSP